MCGVIAMCTAAGPAPDDVALLQALVRESAIRGLHACGVAHVGPEGVAVKRFMDPTLLARHLGEAALGAITICHTRYSTSGDWRTPENNQPIELAGRVLSFNGCISMAPPAEWPLPPDGGAYTSYNDGEILLRKLQAGEDVAAWVAGARFSFAGVYWDGAHAWALRNARRPLWWAKTPGRVLVASTRDILRRAGVSDASEEVPPCMAIALA